ncbi:hypothetical protein [Oceanobacillus damuensis]|uniref:hypothetical protein n=1 Tax=Oceanobacillus damuensis TaxID=937928 RepID=UPI000829C8B7|nr:hypothetical protein [Oceanobacillus damuensis]
MSNQQYWGICRGNGQDVKIVRVYTNYDAAIEESVMYTLETAVSHFVQEVFLKEENNESK